MLAATKDEELDEKLIAILNQLNQALDLLAEDEKQKVLELNLAAGKKAKASAAYEAAAGLLRIAKELLPAFSWKNNYNKTYETYFDLAEAEILARQFEHSKKHAEDILNKF